MKKNVMDIFVTRPVLSIVICIVLCFSGLQAIRGIPILQFPKIESSSLVITTVYTGASAEVIKGYISEPIERVAVTVPGVEFVDSSSQAGLSTVTAWLKLNEDSTRAVAELNARLSEVGFELPKEAEDPVISVSRADRPHAVFYLNVITQDIPLPNITDYLSRQVTPLLNNIPGVQKALIEGSRVPAMRVWLDSERMNIFNVSAQEVYKALETNNVISTLGYTETGQQRIDLVSNTQLSTATDFKELIVKSVDDHNIYLRDIARVERAFEEPTLTARHSLDNTVYISVWPLPGANEIAIGDALYDVVGKINPTLKHGIKLNFAYDGTQYMRDALKEIFKTLFETILLVGVVVLFMMGSFKSALVPLVTIPISILGAVAGIYVMGFSLNLLTVLAIVLSVGLVVDDAIVVVENVSRHMREGAKPIEAALRSSRQLLVPIISMTLTLSMVYTPIGFLAGLTGALLKEFAFTLALAVFISGVVAITLSPVMSAYVSPEGGREGRLTKWVNNVFYAIQVRYTNGLQRSFGWSWQIMFMALAFSLLTVPFYLQSDKELAPVEDQNFINVLVQSPPESSLAYNEKYMYPIVEELLKTDGTFQMWQNIYVNGGFGGLEFVKPYNRDHSVMDKLPEVYGKLVQTPELNLLPLLPSPLPTAGNFDVEFIVKSSDTHADMKKYADQLVGAAFQSGEFLYADTDLKIDLPQIEINLDRGKIADLGMTITDVSSQLGIYLSSNYVNRFDSDGKAYRVIPIADNSIRNHPEKILSLNIKAPNGTLLPLSAVASIDWITVPRQLATFGQQNAFRIFGGVLPGSTKERALAALEKAAHDILPEYYNIDYAGESRDLRKDGNSLLGVLVISLLIMYLLLAVQFNSFRDPLVVLLGSVPLAMSGALLLSFIELTTMNIYSQIGLITLVGLVAKNGILIVEFANHLQEAGKSKLEAVQEAAATRLRPILMTTAATVFGHLPLVMVTGAGAMARNSIGIILVAGIIIGTLFTLFVLPVFYMKFAETREAKPEVMAEEAEPVQAPSKPAPQFVVP
ncbi:efflux RND transporter permease subunit [Paraneptunicella aestuarii]|uniref:efflux RND transporter permease subunit n=1 Tax=Paraneptunicella aestuarii TaxID=2831148 RepID=UPI001E37323B|nr:efflux RND transporter permease subunit [Paraneptunicella aestuarii]UAA39910.1 efflux RND transporter permease subunit [Paraneptunicella aestuarii]